MLGSDIRLIPTQSLIYLIQICAELIKSAFDLHFRLQHFAKANGCSAVQERLVLPFSALLCTLICDDVVAFVRGVEEAGGRFLHPQLLFHV